MQVSRDYPRRMSTLVAVTSLGLGPLAVAQEMRCVASEPPKVLDSSFSTGMAKAAFLADLRKAGASARLSPIPDYSVDETTLNPNLLRDSPGIYFRGHNHRDLGAVTASITIVNGYVSDLTLSAAAREDGHLTAIEKGMPIDDLLTVIRQLKSQGYLQYVESSIPDRPVYSLDTITEEEFAAYDSWSVHFSEISQPKECDIYGVFFRGGKLVKVLSEKVP